MADKHYNIENIGSAIFNGSSGKAPQFLTASGASPPSGFLGREQELQQIHTLLQNGQNTLLVNSEGGMGKTSLAAKYWAEFAAQYQHCAWIFCASPILAEMQDKLAQPLGLKDYFDQETDLEKRLAALKSAMAQLEQPCLLVLDNANDEGHIHGFLTYMSGLNWRVLFTSRCQGVLPNRDAEIKISGLPPDLAKALFKRNHDEKTPEFEALLDRFLRAVDYNTLCIDIFSKNLHEAQGWGDDMAAFLHKLETQGLLLDEHSFTISTDYARTNAAGRILSKSDEIIEALYNFAELDEIQSSLLIRLALLPAETHAAEVLKTLLADGDPIQLGKQLAGLSRKGWLAAEPGNAYRLSPVVQKAVLQKHRAKLWVEAEPMIKVLIGLFDYEGTHAKNIEVVEPYADLVFGIVDLLQSKQKDLNTLYDGLWVYYEAVGNLRKALQCAKRMLSMNEKIYNKIGMAISYEKMGETHMGLGNLDKALGFFEQYNQMAIELQSAFSQNEAFKNSAALSYSKLGIIHIKLGNLHNALGFFKQCNQLAKELHNAFPSKVSFKNLLAVSWQFLGDTHAVLGDSQQALSFFEKFNKLEKELHDTFPQKINFKNGFALSCQFLGKAHTALGNFMQALDFFKQYNQLEEELYNAFPQNVEFKNDLAISYLLLGQFHMDQWEDIAQAKENIRKGWELYEQLVQEFPDHAAFKGNYEWAKKALAALE